MYSLPEPSRPLHIIVHVLSSIALRLAVFWSGATGIAIQLERALACPFPFLFSMYISRFPDIYFADYQNSYMVHRPQPG